MASSNNQNAPNVPAPDMEKALTRSGQFQGAVLVVKPPTEVPVGQVVRYVAVLKLNYAPTDFDKWKYFGATAWAINEAAGTEKQLTCGQIPVAYPIDIPGKPEPAWCIIFPHLVFPEEGTFRLQFNLCAFKGQESTLPEGSPIKPGMGDAGSVRSESITVKKMAEGTGLRNSPGDYSDNDRKILTAIENYRKEGKPLLAIQPTIFVQLSEEEQKAVDKMKKNPEEAK